jgi:non-canonical (house-cleaning) NTP pyrophosphatase
MRVPDAVATKLFDGTGKDLEQIMASLGLPADIGDHHGSYAAWSDNMLTRTDQFRMATQCAIVPFFNKYYGSK